MPADPRIERYLEHDRPWVQEMRALRHILLSKELRETLKWRIPVYMAHGKNVANIAAMKDYCALGFFNGALLDDPDGLLVAPGQNSRYTRLLKFNSVTEIDARRAKIEEFLDAAIENERLGRKVEVPAAELEYPAELTAAFAMDPSFQSAFAALTPGRRRGYLLHFSGAKQSVTRANRIERAKPKIFEGKGLQDR